MQMKKTITLILMSLLCLSLMVGCSSGKEAGNSLATEPLDATEDVFSVGDEKITFNEFRYYIYISAMETAYAIDANSVNDIAKFDWDQKNEDGTPLQEKIIEKALNSALNDSIMIKKAKENGIVISKEEVNNNNQAIENVIAQNGEESFLLSANAMGITDVESYKKLANRMQALENAEKEISANIENYMDANVDLSKWKSDEKVTAQHVLISNESDKFSDPKATANAVLAKAKAGEDFADLIAEYNEDPGATAAGYTFGRGEMVKEFEEASYALDCGEISDVVVTQYGYHIIRRVAGLAELQNYWLNETKYDLNEKALKKISIKDIMTSAASAQKKVQSMNQTQK